MSEHTVAEQSDDAPLFARDEIEQFDADDAEAGRAIGKMLSFFFLYTVIVMLISSIATYIWVNSPQIQ